ncbi:MAG: hypothetical protein SNI70_11960 [Rikenellaceae bacterium]
MMSQEQYESYLEVVDNALENDLYDDPEFEIDELQEQIIDMELEVCEAIDYYSRCDSDHENMYNKLKRLIKKISEVKEKYEFYDEQSTLDMMFPDGFDEE